MIKIAPSILAADMAILRDQVQIAEEAGADWFHLDVMDGHFVPNITFGPLMVEAMRKITELPLDVHLMIENPDQYLQAFRDAGADLISVHVEAVVHLQRTLSEIRKLGAKAGAVLNPATPVSWLEHVLEDVDLILVMSVNPGFGGQKFIPAAVEKVRRIAEMLKQNKREIYLEVDGGVDRNTAPLVAAAGANVLVAGSAIFAEPDIRSALEAIKAAARKSVGLE